MVQAVLTPARARRFDGRSNLDPQSILFSIDTDIALDGMVARHWLIATFHELIVARSHDHSSLDDRIAEDIDILRRIPWRDITGVRTVAGVGSGRLQARQGDTWTDLVRYTNSLSHRFHNVSRRLDTAINELHRDGIAIDANTLSLDGDRLDTARCEQCNLRLPNSSHDAAESCPRCMQRGWIFKRVWELIAPYRNGAIVLALLTLFGVAAELVPPKLQQYMVDHILLSGAGGTAPSTDFRTALLVVVLMLAASRLVLSGVGFVKGRLATAIGCGLTGRLRDEMVTKLTALSVAYYDRHNTGSIISRVQHDSEALHGLMHQFTGGFLLQMVKLVGVGIMLFWINPKLAAFTLIPVPLVFLGSWVFWKKVYPRYYRLRDASAKQLSALNGMLNGIRVVKAFGQEDREYERFHDARQRLTAWRLWVDVTNAGYSATMQVVFSLGGLIVWYVGGRDVIGNAMTLGELIAFLAYLAMFYAPLGALSNFTTWLTSFLSGSKRVLELLDTPVSIGEPLDPVKWDAPRGDIRFDNVTFGYDPNQPVLKDVSFSVSSGEMIGIVGRSGSGKTTIVNLLSRFYDVQEGRITIDGNDVRRIAAGDLRDNIGSVLQDSFLFRGTIWKNLCYGRSETTIEDALRAAKAAGAHDFICRQPLGYDTMLGQQGAGLSGGEKQRLSIARTLLYDPQILILDEATSNIDAESEKLIQDALTKLTDGRTTVAIAHRLSTLRNADRILVFDRGELVEQGSHTELIARDGKYARMVRIQMRVTKNPNVDQLLEGPTDQSRESAVAAEDECSIANSELDRSEMAMIRLLDATELTFSLDSLDGISLAIDGGERYERIFCVRIFPASNPRRYISVRRWDENGEEVEVGILQDLDELREDNREIVNRSLGLHYLLRRITRLHNVTLAHGYLDLDVETEVGRENVTMRWTASQAIEFGERGKLIIDTEDNRYVVDDVDTLPKPEREKFLQFIYW